MQGSYSLNCGRKKIPIGWILWTKPPPRIAYLLNRIAYLWKQVLQIFSHYEFLVQLVFAPCFKQRHIPRYNYIKRQQEKKPTWNRQEQRPVNAAHVLKQRIAKCFCFRPLTEVLAGKSNAPPGGPHLGSNSPLYGAQRKSN